MQKRYFIKLLSIVFLSSIAIVGCNGGGSSNSNPNPTPTSSPTPTPPAPSSTWVSSNFQQFLVTAGITGYTFNPNEFELNKVLYFLGTNGSSNGIISYDLLTKTWSNITYNLSNATDLRFLTYGADHASNNTSIYITANNQLYLLNGNNWSQVGSIPNGYQVSSLGFNGTNYTMLATNNNTDNSVVYNVNGTTLTQLASFNLGQSGASLYTVTNSSDWVAVSDSNYVLSSNTSSVLPLPQVNNGYINSYSNGIFTYGTYLCSPTGCSQIKGANPTPLSSINNPYFFSNALLNNGQTQVQSNIIGYQANNTFYNCSFNTLTATLSNCSPVANGVNGGLTSIYFKINSGSFSIGINNDFGYFFVNNNQWQSLSPTNPPISGSKVMGATQSFCFYNPTQSLLYTTAYDLSTQTISYFYADPYANNWTSFNVPTGGSLSMTGIVTTTSGNTISTSSYGFKSIVKNNNNLSDLYTYSYNSPCSQTFN